MYHEWPEFQPARSDDSCMTWDARGPSDCVNLYLPVTTGTSETWTQCAGVAADRGNTVVALNSDNCTVMCMHMLLIMSTIRQNSNNSPTYWSEGTMDQSLAFAGTAGLIMASVTGVACQPIFIGKRAALQISNVRKNGLQPPVSCYVTYNKEFPNARSGCRGTGPCPPPKRAKIQTFYFRIVF